TILWAAWMTTNWSDTLRRDQQEKEHGGIRPPPNPGPAVNVLIAVSNRGATFFLVRPDPYDGTQLCDFLARLANQLERRFNIVLSWRPSRNCEDLRSWIETNSDNAAVRFTTA